MISYLKINKNIAQQHKEKFLCFFENVLIINNIKLDENEILSTYDNMLEFLDDGSAIIVGAFENDELIGFIWAYERMVNKDRRFHINYFIVDEDYRKKGIGKNLISEIYSIADSKGINSVELMVTKSNENAINFYLKEGFEGERVSLCKNI